jgi:WD40 repeat protein
VLECIITVRATASFCVHAHAYIHLASVHACIYTCACSYFTHANSQAAVLARTLQGHKDTVTCVAKSCEHIASCGFDGSIMIWNADGSQLLHTIEKAHGGKRVFRLDWSEDGGMLVSGGGDNDIKLWEIKKNGAPPTLLRTLKGHTDTVSAVWFSPDGKRIASASLDKTVMCWSVQTGLSLWTFTGHKGAVLCLAWSPDGELIASAGEEGGIIRMLDAAAGTQVRELKGGHTLDVWCLAFGATRGELYSGSVGESIAAWKIEEGGEASVTRILKGHTDCGNSFSLSPDKRLLVSGSAYKTVRVWEIATGQQLGVLEGHTWVVPSVVWSADGESIVSGSFDKTVRMWRVSEKVCVCACTSEIICLCLSFCIFVNALMYS